MALCFLRNLKVLAFGGLGKLFNSSLATEKPNFWQLTILTQDHVNHRKPVDHVFYKILGKMDFQWLRRTYQ